MHFLIARFTHRTILCHNAFSFFFNSRHFSLSSANHNHKDHSFKLSNILKSSGLSPETILKLSKKLQIKNPNCPNAVIEILRSYGFSDSDLSKLVKKNPLVLLSDVENTLLPKLKFLQSIGASITDFPKILLGNVSYLSTSLEKNIKPRYQIIRSLVRDDKEVISALKHWSWKFYSVSMANDSVPNIEVLRKLGVPQSLVSHLVSNYPNVVFAKHSRFVEAVNFVKEMGFNPLKSNFVLAVQVIAKMGKETWESKLKIFEKWGWSRDICLLAFRKYPQYMSTSEKKILKIMSFLVKDVALTPEDIARIPWLLSRNLEKTLVPRCAVVKILKSRGLIKSGLRISSFIVLSEKTFLEKYVTPFEKDLPLVLDAYKGQKSD